MKPFVVIPKLALVILALSASLCFQLFFPGNAVAKANSDDTLRGTTWNGVLDPLTFYFLDNGKVRVGFWENEKIKYYINGTYQQDADSAEMSFEDKSRATGSI